MKRMFGVVLVLLVVAPLRAQAPILPEMVKLQLSNALKTMQIAQLEANAAQVKFDAAKQELTRLVMANQKDGYAIDVEKLDYVAKAKPVEVEKK